MVDRDVSITPVDTLHHVQGLSNLSSSVERRKEHKDEKNNRRHERQKDEKIEEELAIVEKELMADEDMDHIDFRA